MYKWLNLRRPDYEHLHQNYSYFCHQNFCNCFSVTINFFVLIRLKEKINIKFLGHFIQQQKNHPEHARERKLRISEHVRVMIISRGYMSGVSIRGNNYKKAVNVRANPVFFCVNCIHNSFANPELITTSPEKKGTLYALFCQKNNSWYFFINNQKTKSR